MLISLSSTVEVVFFSYHYLPRLLLYLRAGHWWLSLYLGWSGRLLGWCTLLLHIVTLLLLLACLWTRKGASHIEIS